MTWKRSERLTDPNHVGDRHWRVLCDSCGATVKSCGHPRYCGPTEHVGWCPACRPPR